MVFFSMEKGYINLYLHHYVFWCNYMQMYIWKGSLEKVCTFFKKCLYLLMSVMNPWRLSSFILSMEHASFISSTKLPSWISRMSSVLPYRFMHLNFVSLQEQTSLNISGRTAKSGTKYHFTILYAILFLVHLTQFWICTYCYT